ncbi:MAG: 1-acyl-sn-glycerol-3-phosphate acyltransferase, partial [Candidatus Thalassarchaeaceae archaeon]|nr:1-acyl-sn-glycerol-3-phosphate acyltransferase [Candidatus Thalassarchaeaceae archaeon]
MQKRYPDTSIRIGAFSTETLPEYTVSGTQEAPDIDPVLSSGALKLNPRKLEKVPWDHTGEHPGSKLAWSAIKSLAILSKYYLFRSIEEQAPKESEGGRIYASIHINGLVDPLSIILSQEKRPITMGRHDLATMPFIGWLTRRMGNQPVIRRAEQSSGVSGAEFALSINHRTLLTMSHCISGGHGAVVMPEGKSHQDSRLHKLRTGAMRFAINASTIAHAKDLPKPVIQPVGLHFR